MKKLYLILFVLPLLAACGPAQTGPKADVGEADLVGKHFVLVSVNGEAFSAERTPNLRFGENMRIFGQACNVFNGATQLKNGVLTVPLMASTMMTCDEKLNTLERDLFTMLRNGAALTLEDGQLFLVGNGLRFEYRATTLEK